MATKITDIKVILTAPEGINLIAVKVETNQDGLYGLGCATFAYRHMGVEYISTRDAKNHLLDKTILRFLNNL